MNFDFTAEENELKRRVAGVFTGEAVSEAQLMERASLEELKRTTGDFLRKLGEIGYLSLCLGPAQASESLKLLAAQEDVARISGSLFLSVETTARLFGGLVAGFGAHDQFSDLLALLAGGRIIAAVAVSEDERPDSGPGFSTVAWEDGESFIVSGTKPFVTNAPIADYIAVAASLDGKPAIFIVKPGDHAVVVGPRLETLGYNGLAVASLELREVRVPKEMVIGPLQNPTLIEFLRRTQDLLLTAASVGLMRRTLTESKKHADSHLRGGKPIFARQEIRFKIAEMLTLTQTAQLLCYRAAWMYSVSDAEAHAVLHCAKVFSAEASERVASMGVQILAGTGYVSGNPVEQAYRESKYAALAGTTTELARMSIAEELLKRHQV
ncbi:MAG: acyl-CoA dehydrogenase [Desulfomonile tiedjei]|uniref:Acyl-CoA dehydrogenase n=1 Tax=Desulfomonile tiedjei TaxID=2358 RepID=A0A9D6V7S5_9BACT|nr:acyl-CoA dehydrogenase [Desulfomonile tiedjei]